MPKRYLDQNAGAICHGKPWNRQKSLVITTATRFQRSSLSEYRVTVRQIEQPCPREGGWRSSSLTRYVSAPGSSSVGHRFKSWSERHLSVAIGASVANCRNARYVWKERVPVPWRDAMDDVPLEAEPQPTQRRGSQSALQMNWERPLDSSTGMYGGFKWQQQWWWCSYWAAIQNRDWIAFMIYLNAVFWFALFQINQSWSMPH